MRRCSELKIASYLLLVIILGVSLFGREWIKAEEDGIRFEHTYPEAMKVGEILGSEYYVNAYGLEPSVTYDGGVYCENIYAFAGDYGGEWFTTNENGEALQLEYLKCMTYKPGEVIVNLYVESYDLNFSETYEVTRIKVEEPIITHNAPNKVNVGDVIDFETVITNTVFEDKKISDYDAQKNFREVFYMPSVEIVEGANLVTQSEQDYTYTLHTFEKLSFTGSGTVKLKITYATKVYDWIWIEGECDTVLTSVQDGNIEKEITIVVEEEKQIPSEPEETPSETPSEVPSEVPGETPSEAPTEEPESEMEESYVVPTDSLIIGKTQLEIILEENAKKDVVIKANTNIEFTLKKGTMSQVEGKEEYDFTADIETDYQEKEEYGNLITKDNFVMQVNFNYSGKLPGEANIKITVGVDRAGMTLYYSKLCADGTIAFICSGAVDENGFLTVRQDSCSDYVLTTERLESVTEEEDVTEEDSQKPQTDGEKPAGPNAWGIVIVIIAIAAGIAWVVYKKKFNKI